MTLIDEIIQDCTLLQHSPSLSLRQIHNTIICHDLYDVLLNSFWSHHQYWAVRPLSESNKGFTVNLFFNPLVPHPSVRYKERTNRGAYSHPLPPPPSHSNNPRGSRMEDVRYKHGVNYRTKPWRPGNWMRFYDCRMADSSGRTSDFILTNSRATSSFVRCDKIRRIVQPVSSMWQRLPKANQQAQEPCK